MYLVGIGVVLLLLKYLEIGPPANWSWLVILAPFGLAIAWWAWADATGYTKRKAMEREDARKAARIEKNKIAMGTIMPKKRR
jgi:small Trp-rich protein